MKSKKTMLTALVAFIAAISLVSATSWPNKPHRIKQEACNAAVKLCTNQFIEEWSDRWIGFVELSDSGSFHNNDYSEAIWRRIGNDLEKGDLILAAYVHGWQHNASSADSDVVAFRSFVEQLAIAENLRYTQNSQSSKRKVVGIYVGWRGRTITVPGLEYITFWSRKAAAENAARSAGNVFDLLSENRSKGSSGCLGKIPRSSALMITGHSFGGLITARALIPKLTTKFAPTPPGPPKASDRYSDLVVLLNPAVEGAQFTELRQYISEFPNKFRPYPELIALTSTADTATRVLFPLGQFVRRPLIALDNPEWRDSVYTIGHLPYQTHEAVWKDADQVRESFDEKAASERRAFAEFEARYRAGGRLEHGWSRVYSSGVTLFDMTAMSEIIAQKTRKRKLAADTPFWFVKTDHSLMNGHSDFNPKLQDLMRQWFDDAILQTDKRSC